MKRMANESNRKAHFVCAAAFAHGDHEHLILGETHGELELQIQAPLISGIPLSSVFKPVGAEKVYAALSVEEKNQLSHRGKAFAELKRHLLNWSS
jgi:XTP/dITP diphosphohydrolase